MIKRPIRQMTDAIWRELVIERDTLKKATGRHIRNAAKYQVEGDEAAHLNNQDRHDFSVERVEIAKAFAREYLARSEALSKEMGTWHRENSNGAWFMDYIPENDIEHDDEGDLVP